MQHWVAHEWASILFVVCLVTVLHSIAYGPLKPLSRLTALVLMHWHAKSATAAAGASNAGSDAAVWLVFIDDVDFEQRYGERRPFNRCTLHQDIATIASGHPKVIAIDLDLSPLADPKSADEEACESALYGLPAHHAAVDFVFVDPLQAVTRKSKERTDDWKRSFIHNQNVYFADSRMKYPLHQAIEYQCENAGLSEVVFDSVTGTLPPACDDRVSLPWLIDYGRYRRDVYRVSAADAIDTAALRGKTVFFGSRAGRADEAMTPIGRLHGVDVHAAKFVSFGSNVRQSHAGNFVIDLGMAAVFSAVMAWFIHCYARRPEEDDVMLRARRTSLWIGFAFAFAVTAGLLVLAARGLTHCGLITEPLLIIIGLTIDGLVVAPWAHQGAHGPDGSCRPLRAVPQAMKDAAKRAFDDWRGLRLADTPHAWSMVLRELLFWAIVISGLYFAFFHH